MKLVLIIAISMAFACFANANVSASISPPPYSQKDPRWGGETLGFGSYTIAQEGCFLTAMTSMIAYEGIYVNGVIPDPSTMNSYFKAHNGFKRGLLLYQAPEQLGFTFEGFLTAKGDVTNALDEGKFVLLHVEHNSHWVLATGYDSNGYPVMDPANVRTSYNYNEVPQVAVYTAPASATAHSSAVAPTPAPAPATPEPTPATPSSSSSDNSLMTESLEANNKWRSEVGVPDLVWNATLAASAQAWADHLASTKVISHSTNRVDIGENLAYGSTRTNTIADFVDLWGAESDYFVAGKPYPTCTSGSESDVWHYTQMVWRKSTQLGCGMGQSNGRSYYVCQYYPRGNMAGQSVL